MVLNDAPRLPGFCNVSASDVSEVLVHILLACGVRCFVKYFIIIETIGPSVDKQLHTMAVPSWIVDHRMAGAKLTVLSQHLFELLKVNYSLGAEGSFTL